MAHYAFLDKNNVVTQVIVGKDENELDAEGNVVDWEKHYSDFAGLSCLRTSYNTINNVHKLGGIPFRKNFAGPGYTYDKDWDAFYPPKPYPSWKLNYETFNWEAPISMPIIPEEDSNIYFYKWSEINKEWVKVNFSLI
jgi:hypothetical protein